jgi:hypothetical protein
LFEYLGIREDLDGRTGLYFLFVVRGYVEMPDLKHAATWLKNNVVGRSGTVPTCGRQTLLFAPVVSLC